MRAVYFIVYFGISTLIAYPLISKALISNGDNYLKFDENAEGVDAISLINYNAAIEFESILPPLPDTLFVGEQTIIYGELINNGTQDITGLYPTLDYNSSQVTMGIEMLDYQGKISPADTQRVKLSIVPTKVCLFEPEIYFHYQSGGVTDSVRWEVSSLIYDRELGQGFPIWHRVRDLSQGFVIDAVSEDFDKDGWLDFVIAYSDSVVVYYNAQNDDFQFTAVTIPETRGWNSYIELFDVDQDGVGEILILNELSDLYEIDGLETGTHTIASMGHLDNMTLRRVFDMQDMDGDGAGELIRIYNWADNWLETSSYPELTRLSITRIGTTDVDAQYYQPLDEDNDGVLEYLVMVQDIDTYGDYVSPSRILKRKEDGTYEQVEIHDYWSFNVPVDIDRDGYTDLLGPGRLVINDSGSGWITGVNNDITEWHGLNEWQDLDGDGDMDRIFDDQNGLRLDYFEYQSATKKLSVVHSQQLFSRGSSLIDEVTRAAGSILSGDFNNDGVLDFITNDEYYDVSLYSNFVVSDSIAEPYFEVSAYYDLKALENDTIDLGEVNLLTDTAIFIPIQNVGNKLVILDWDFDHILYTAGAERYRPEGTILASGQEMILKVELDRLEESYTIDTKVTITSEAGETVFWIQGNIGPSERIVSFEFDSLAEFPPERFQLLHDTAKWSFVFTNQSTESFEIKNISLSPLQGVTRIWTDYQYPLTVDPGDFKLDAYIEILDSRSDIYWERYNLPFNLVIEYDHLGSTRIYERRFSLGSRSVDGFVYEIDNKRYKNGDTLRVDVFDTLDFQIQYQWYTGFNLKDIVFSTNYYYDLTSGEFPYRLANTRRFYNGQFSYINFCETQLDSLTIIAGNSSDPDPLRTEFTIFIQPVSNEEIRHMKLEKWMIKNKDSISLAKQDTISGFLINKGNVAIENISNTVYYNPLDISVQVNFDEQDVPLSPCDSIAVEIVISALQEGVHEFNIVFYYDSDTQSDSISWSDTVTFFEPILRVASTLDTDLFLPDTLEIPNEYSNSFYVINSGNLIIDGLDAKALFNSPNIIVDVNTDSFIEKLYPGDSVLVAVRVKPMEEGMVDFSIRIYYRSDDLSDSITYNFRTTVFEPFMHVITDLENGSIAVDSIELSESLQGSFYLINLGNIPVMVSEPAISTSEVARLDLGPVTYPFNLYPSDSLLFEYSIDAQQTGEYILDAKVIVESNADKDTLIIEWMGKVYEAISLGVVHGAGLSLYPVPADDLLIINGLVSSSKAKLYDLTGKLIETATLEPFERAKFIIKIGHMKPGYYLLHVDDRLLPFVKN